MKPSNCLKGTEAVNVLKPVPENNVPSFAARDTAGIIALPAGEMNKWLKTWCLKGLSSDYWFCKLLQDPQTPELAKEDPLGILIDFLDKNNRNWLQNIPY